MHWLARPEAEPTSLWGISMQHTSNLQTCVSRLPLILRTTPETIHVCSFVVMYTTSVQQGPGGAPWGFPVDTHHLNSDAGYAVLPLTLLGAPVSIRRALGGLMA